MFQDAAAASRRKKILVLDFDGPTAWKLWRAVAGLRQNSWQDVMCRTDGDPVFVPQRGLLKDIFMHLDIEIVIGSQRGLLDQGLGQDGQRDPRLNTLWNVLAQAFGADRDFLKDDMRAHISAEAHKIVRTEYFTIDQFAHLIGLIKAIAAAELAAGTAEDAVAAEAAVKLVEKAAVDFLINEIKFEAAKDANSLMGDIETRLQAPGEEAPEAMYMALSNNIIGLLLNVTKVPLLRAVKKIYGDVDLIFADDVKAYFAGELTGEANTIKYAANEHAHCIYAHPGVDYERLIGEQVMGKVAEPYHPESTQWIMEVILSAHDGNAEAALAAIRDSGMHDEFKTMCLEHPTFNMPIAQDMLAKRQDLPSDAVELRRMAQENLGLFEAVKLIALQEGAAPEAKIKFETIHIPVLFQQLAQETDKHRRRLLVRKLWDSVGTLRVVNVGACNDLLSAGLQTITQDDLNELMRNKTTDEAYDQANNPELLLYRPVDAALTARMMEALQGNAKINLTAHLNFLIEHNYAIFSYLWRDPYITALMTAQAAQVNLVTRIPGDPRYTDDFLQDFFDILKEGQAPEVMATTCALFNKLQAEGLDAEQAIRFVVMRYFAEQHVVPRLAVKKEEFLAAVETRCASKRVSRLTDSKLSNAVVALLQQLRPAEATVNYLMLPTDRNAEDCLKRALSAVGYPSPWRIESFEGANGAVTAIVLRYGLVEDTRRLTENAEGGQPLFRYAMTGDRTFNVTLLSPTIYGKAALLSELHAAVERQNTGDVEAVVERILSEGATRDNFLAIICDTIDLREHKIDRDSKLTLVASKLSVRVSSKPQSCTFMDTLLEALERDDLGEPKKEQIVASFWRVAKKDPGHAKQKIQGVLDRVNASGLSVQFLNRLMQGTTEHELGQVGGVVELVAQRLNPDKCRVHYLALIDKGLSRQDYPRKLLRLCIATQVELFVCSHVLPFKEAVAEFQRSLAVDEPEIRRLAYHFVSHVMQHLHELPEDTQKILTEVFAKAKHNSTSEAASKILAKFIVEQLVLPELERDLAPGFQAQNAPRLNAILREVFDAERPISAALDGMVQVCRESVQASMRLFDQAAAPFGLQTDSLQELATQIKVLGFPPSAWNLSFYSQEIHQPGGAPPLTEILAITATHKQSGRSVYLGCEDNRAVPGAFNIGTHIGQLPGLAPLLTLNGRNVVAHVQNIVVQDAAVEAQQPAPDYDEDSLLITRILLKPRTSISTWVAHQKKQLHPSNVTERLLFDALGKLEWHCAGLARMAERLPERDPERIKTEKILETIRVVTEGELLRDVAQEKKDNRALFAFGFLSALSAGAATYLNERAIDLSGDAGVHFTKASEILLTVVQQKALNATLQMNELIKYTGQTTIPTAFGALAILGLSAAIYQKYFSQAKVAVPANPLDGLDAQAQRDFEQWLVATGKLSGGAPEKLVSALEELSSDDDRLHHLMELLGALAATNAAERALQTQSNAATLRREAPLTTAQKDLKATAGHYLGNATINRWMNSLSLYALCWAAVVTSVVYLGLWPLQFDTTDPQSFTETEIEVSVPEQRDGIDNTFSSYKMMSDTTAMLIALIWMPFALLYASKGLGWGLDTVSQKWWNRHAPEPAAEVRDGDVQALQIEGPAVAPRDNCLTRCWARMNRGWGDDLLREPLIADAEEAPVKGAPEPFE